jgi:hypothetical protein
MFSFLRLRQDNLILPRCLRSRACCKTACFYRDAIRSRACGKIASFYRDAAIPAPAARYFHPCREPLSKSKSELSFLHRTSDDLQIGNAMLCGADSEVERSSYH